MPPIPVVNDDIGEKLANESNSSESLDRSNSLDKTEEPFLPHDEEKSAGTERIALKKNVSLINGIGLIVGTVIGSGIFVSPTSILEESNSIGASLLVWLGCGVLALFGSLCYAELGTAFKKSGGEYTYLMEAFGRIPAYLFAWTSVLIIRPASGAIIALTFAEYVAKPFYPDCEAPTILVKLLACSCLGKPPSPSYICFKINQGIGLNLSLFSRLLCDVVPKEIWSFYCTTGGKRVKTCVTCPFVWRDFIFCKLRRGLFTIVRKGNEYSWSNRSENRVYPMRRQN